MIRVLACLLAVLAGAGQAVALSCVPPDVAASFQAAAQSERVYVVVHGRLSYDVALLPQPIENDINNMPPETRIPARLTGKSLAKAGFVNAFDAPVTLNIQCWGPWCGGIDPDVPVLLFVEKTGAGFVMATEPCGQFAFHNPTPQQLKTLSFCMRGAACKAKSAY